MSEGRALGSFLIPWTGGLMAGWGDLSPLGIGWAALVLIGAIILHNRVTDRHNPKGPSRYAQAKTKQVDE